MYLPNSVAHIQVNLHIRAFALKTPTTYTVQLTNSDALTVTGKRSVSDNMLPFNPQQDQSAVRDVGGQGGSMHSQLGFIVVEQVFCQD